MLRQQLSSTSPTTPPPLDVPIGERCVAARSVAWLICSANEANAADDNPSAPYVHLLLLVLKDASPTVRAHGAAALCWLARHGAVPRCIPSRVRRPLLDACCNALQGTDPPLWQGVADAACVYAAALPKGTIYFIHFCCCGRVSCTRWCAAYVLTR